MNSSGITRQRLAAIFLLGSVLFNYPLLSLFNKPEEILDVPLLYIYIFALWAVLIALMAYVIEKRKD
jgi:Na+-driven multidrug efflux pump